MEEDVEEVRATLEKVKERVYRLCLRYPFVRNNYAALILLYWMTYDGLKWKRTLEGFSILIPYNSFGRLTSPETITRAFRLLQQEGKVQADPMVRKMRKTLEEAFRRAVV